MRNLNPLRLMGISLIACLLFVTSCGKKESALSLVPQESPIVITLDLKSIIKKADLKSMKDNKIFKDLLEGMGGTTTKQLLDDPTKSGIDFDEAFAFVVPRQVDTIPSAADVDEFYAFEHPQTDIALLLSLKSKSKFTRNIENIIKEDGRLISIKEENDVSYLADDGMVIAWDSDRAIIAQMDVREVLKLFALTPEKSITTNADFAGFYKNKTDVGLWMNYEKFITFADAFNKQMYGKSLLTNDQLVDAKGLYVHSNMQFNNGNITLTSTATPTVQAKKLYEKYYTKKNIDPQVLSYFPEEAFALLAVNLNWVELTKMFGSTGEYPQEILDVVNSLKGDLVGSLSEFPKEKMPEFTVAATVNDHKIYDLIFKQMGNFPKKEMQGYTVLGNENFYLLIAQRNDILFVTSNEDNIKKFTKDETLHKNLTKSSFKKELESPAFLYMNLDLDEYPQWLRTMLSIQPGNATMLNLFKDLKCTYDAESVNATVVLRFKNKQDNSLAMIIKAAEEMSK